MLKNFNFFLDFEEFDDVKPLPVPQHNYAILSTGNKKISPSTTYIFKTFCFDCISSNDQKRVLQTFSQICSQKNQYLQSYKGISFFFQSKYNPTFSMRSITTTTLDNLLQNSKTNFPWTIFDMLKCLFSVAEGLSYLHDQIICHGNLCPSNILIDQAKQCYVCDFGLYPIKKLYMNNNDIANNDYRDPLMGNNEPNFKNDVYSYGILLCQLCLIFYMPTNNITLHDFILNPDKDKYKDFPSFFSELIISCLSSYQERPSFKQIISHFQNSQAVVDSYYMKDIYHNFTESNYIVNLATLGDSYSLNKLGKMFEYGKGVEKNDQKALFSYEKAAKMDNSEAKSNYGILLLENPNRTEDDKIKAAHYLKESAEQGNVHGMANFGIALKLGDGVNPDLNKALEYLKKSADLGYSYAQVNYGYTLLENNPSNDQIKEGLKYIKKSMNQNNAYAFFVYGFMLKNGISIEKDVSLSKKYFQIAADMGYKEASEVLGDSDDSFELKNPDFKKKYYHMVSEKVEVDLKKSRNDQNSEQTSENISVQSPTTNESSVSNDLQLAYSISSSSSFAFDSASEGNVKNGNKKALLNNSPVKDDSDNESTKKVEENSSSSSISTALSNATQPSESQAQNQSSSLLISNNPNSDSTTTANKSVVKTTNKESVEATTTNKPKTTNNEIVTTIKETVATTTVKEPVTAAKVATVESVIATTNTNKDSVTSKESVTKTTNNESTTKAAANKKSTKKSSGSLSKIVPAESAVSLPQQTNTSVSQIQYPSSIFSSIPPSYFNSYQYYNLQNLQMLSNSVVASSMNSTPVNQSYMGVNLLNNLTYQNEQNYQNAQNYQTTQKTKKTRKEAEKIIDPSYSNKSATETNSTTTTTATINSEKDTQKLLAEFNKMKEKYKSSMKDGAEYKDRSKYDLFKNEDMFIKTNNPLIIYKYAKLYSKTGQKSDSAKMIKYYKMAADLGNAKAQNMYGIALQDGIDVEQNLKVGLLYLEKSAKQGDSDGLFNYGLALYHGEGTKKNKELGLKYLKEATDKGQTYAQLYYGQYTDNYIEGHQIIQKLADENISEAFMPLANDFMIGRGVEQNYQKAAEILKNLYDAENDIKVLIKLIDCLKPIDYKLALDYIKILAELDDNDQLNDIRYAQLEYGMELVRGEYFTKNIEEGNRYIIRSTLIQELRKQYPEIYAQLPHDFSSVKRKVDLFLTRNQTINPAEESIINSAYNGNVDDTFKAAKMIEESGDNRTANFFYEIAADSNHRDSAFILAEYYSEGMNGLKINKSKSDRYYKKAAELGHPIAKFELMKHKIKQNKKIKYEKLEALFPEISEIANEKYVPAIIFKAIYFIHKESFDEAENELDTALSLIDQNDFHTKYKIGKLMISIPDKIEKGNEILISCCENEPKANYLLGKYYSSKSYRTLGDLILAEEYLNKAASKKIKDSRRLLASVRKDISSECKQTQIETPQPKEIKEIKETKPKETKPKQTKQTKQKQTKQKNEEIIENDEEQYIDTDLPINELLKKGDEFYAKKIFMDAFQYYEVAAMRGDPVGYFKCARTCDDFNRKLEYYQNAILNKVEGAFSEWRKCIVDHVSQHHGSDLYHKYAELFEEYGDYSDAAILYKRVREKEKYESCYNMAKENMNDIKDGEQQLDFGKLLEINNETEMAVSMYKKASENGIKQAERKIKEISRNKFRQIQHLGQVESLVQQGICYFEGRNGTPIDINKAMECFKEASQIGSPKADYYIGVYYRKYSRYNKLKNQLKCVEYFKNSADAGDSDGQNGYGDCLRLGFGIDKDLDKAIYYYKLSADQGNVTGEYNYGREMYLKSYKIEDRNIAITYLKKAAEKQYPDAMYFYSKVIRTTNPEESESYLKLSIDKSSEFAIKDYGKELINEGKLNEAAELYKSAAQKGMKIGFRKYAKFIDKGCALEEDLNEDLLVDYLKKAALLGDPKDQFNYAEFLLLQDESVDERASYFMKAAKHGYVKAFFRYAECLEDGEGVEKNLEKAKKYYTLSYQYDNKSPAKIIIDRLKKDNLIDC